MKYVDDTTVAEIVSHYARSDAASAVKFVEGWTKDQHISSTLTSACKEIVIDFKRNKHAFDPIKVAGKELEVVNSAKILGVTLSGILKWNEQIRESIKKANKRLYFLVLLERTGVPPEDIICFYCTTIRAVLEYCSTVFHHALPTYLSEELERVQKRALSIISSEQTDLHSLATYQLESLYDRRVKQCNRLFDTISSPGHKLSALLPPKHVSKYNTRKKDVYNIPKMRTDRFRRSFISAMCECANVQVS